MSSRTINDQPPAPRQPHHDDTDTPINENWTSIAPVSEAPFSQVWVSDEVVVVDAEPQEHDEFDYRDLVYRDDPAHPPRALDSVPTALSLQDDQDTLDGALDGDLTATLSYTAAALGHAATDTRTAEAMLGVLAGFVDRALRAGHTTWHDVDADHVVKFVALRNGNTHPTVEARRLRKNAVHAGWLAHGMAVPDLPEVTLGIDPVQDHVRQDKRGQGTGPAEKRRPAVSTRPATHDEVTLLRLAAPASANRKTAHAPAGALALLSSGASVREAAELGVHTVVDTDSVTLLARETSRYLTRRQVRQSLELPGTGDADGRSIGTPLPRTGRPLDSWEQQALLDLLHEMSTQGRTLPDDYVLYGERGEFNRKSAAVTVTQHLTKLRKHADLTREAGLTPNSLRMWGVIRDVTCHRDAVKAARHFGTSGLTLLRLVRQQGDRNWD